MADFIKTLSEMIWSANLNHSNAMNEISKKLKLDEVHDGPLEFLTHKLHWEHGLTEEDLWLLIPRHPDQVSEWLRWNEITFKCIQCNSAIRLIFRDRPQQQASNFGEGVCQRCYRLRVLSEENEKREKTRLAKVAELRALPYDDYLKTEHWQQTRLEALERDGHRCRLCNSPDRLNVHHRSYERLGEELPDDLTTLCQPCHESFHDHRHLVGPNGRNDIDRHESGPSGSSGDELGSPVE